MPTGRLTIYRVVIDGYIDIWCATPEEAQNVWRDYDDFKTGNKEVYECQVPCPIGRHGICSLLNNETLNGETKAICEQKLYISKDGEIAGSPLKVRSIK